jgi:hypothetical protein
MWRRQLTRIENMFGLCFAIMLTAAIVAAYI